jgi:hypothetical protein
LFTLYGIVYAILDGNQRALVADLSSDKHRSTALGTYHTITGVIALPSSLIAGLIWEIVNPTVTFLVGGILSLLTVTVFLLFKNYFK